MERVKLFGRRFLKDFPSESQVSPEGYAHLRLLLSTALYYKLLEGIIRAEEKKNPDFGQLQVWRGTCVPSVDRYVCRVGKGDPARKSTSKTRGGGGTCIIVVLIL